ncbi:MAG: hypothetical protein H5U38_11415 [Calditrichaeota bacterium]|nr:hypothetical protein [Calditrichota bacterium]
MNATPFLTAVVVALATQRCRQTTMSLEDLVRWHLAHHAGIQVQDVYKMFHQAVYGPAHILADPERALRELRREWLEVQASGEEPLAEPISPDHSVVRLNLRRYKQMGGAVEALWQALLESAGAMHSSDEAFFALWRPFAAAVRRGELPFSAWEVAAMEDSLAKRGVVAVHHSEAYRRANAPAYRVLTAAALRRLRRSLAKDRGGKP